MNRNFWSVLLLLSALCLSVNGYEVTNAELDRIAQTQRARQNGLIDKLSPERMAALEQKVATENRDKAASAEEAAAIKAAWKKATDAELQGFVLQRELRAKAREEYLKRQNQEHRKYVEEKHREKIEYPPPGMARSYIYFEGRNGL